MTEQIHYRIMLRFGVCVDFFRLRENETPDKNGRFVKFGGDKRRYFYIDLPADPESEENLPQIQNRLIKIAEQRYAEALSKEKN